jgi:hypothetical protein
MLTEADFTSTGRFQYYSHVYDSDKGQPGGGAPRYEIYFERKSGDVYQLYRKGRAWRMAPHSTSVVPYGPWQPLS